MRVRCVGVNDLLQLKPQVIQTTLNEHTEGLYIETIIEVNRRNIHPNSEVITRLVEVFSGCGLHTLTPTADEHATPHGEDLAVNEFITKASQAKTETLQRPSMIEFPQCTKFPARGDRKAPFPPRPTGKRSSIYHINHVEKASVLIAVAGS